MLQTTYSEEIGKGLGLDDTRVGGVEKSESLLEFDFRHDCKVWLVVGNEWDEEERKILTHHTQIRKKNKVFTYVC